MTAIYLGIPLLISSCGFLKHDQAGRLEQCALPCSRWGLPLRSSHLPEL